MRWITLPLAAALLSAPLLAGDKTSDRLNEAANLFSEVMATPDRAIPQGLLNRAYCMVLVPGLKKAAVLVGGKYGRGYAVCRAAGGQAGDRRRPFALKAAAWDFRPAMRRRTSSC